MPCNRRKLSSPWLTISDGLTDSAIARAEDHQQRLRASSLDDDDKAELAKAEHLLDVASLIAILQRKPLLGRADPETHHAILDAIETARKATRQTLRNRRTREQYLQLAAEVWIELTLDSTLSKKDAMARVAARHKFKKSDRKLTRACTMYGVRKPQVPKTM